MQTRKCWTRISFYRKADVRRAHWTNDQATPYVLDVDNPESQVLEVNVTTQPQSSSSLLASWQRESELDVKRARKHEGRSDRRTTLYPFAFC